jgi:MFS superfamily sulfate permease-like transporter
MALLRPDRSHLQADAIAGLTFAVVNVPQAMAHALLAAVNPVIGIYTLMVAAPAAALVTSSVYMNVSTAVPSHQLTLLQIYGSLFFAAAKNFEQMLPSVDDTDRAVVALALRGNYRIIVEGVIDPM